MSARVIAVGKGTNHTMAYSDNSGVTWTGLGDDVFSARAYDIAYNSTQDKFLAVGKGTGWAYYSHEGLVWKQTGENKFLDGRGIATNGDRWVAVGKGNNSKNRSMMRSDNGINWTSISNSRTDLFTTYGTSVEVYGNKWVAVGKGANHVIAYSHDNAETWTHALAVDASNTKTLITTEANTVSTNGSRWIVGGKGTSSGDYMLLVYSDDDGKTWAKVDDPVIDTFNEIFGSHYDGEKFWISGTSTGVKLAYSTDGLSWTVVTGSYYLKARGFITFDGMTIMGGDTLASYNIAYSDNSGSSWTEITNSRSEIFSDNVWGFAYRPPPPPPEPIFVTGVSMPNKIGVADQNMSFTLGRKAFFKNIDESHKIKNMGKNIDYSSVLNSISSNVYAKPIGNNSTSLRTQRLRLSATGHNSSRVNKKDEQITLGNADTNFVSNALSRVRGGGGMRVKR